MVKIGKYNTLKIVKDLDFGVYLDGGNSFGGGGSFGFSLDDEQAVTAHGSASTERVEVSVSVRETPRLERLARNGNPIPAPELPPGRYRVYSQDREFLCLSQWEKGQLRSVKNFFGG